MSDDIVWRLRRWVDREISEDDPAGAISAAIDEIVELRHRLAELGAIVRTSRTRKEATEAADRLAPMDVRSLLLNGFHQVDKAWRSQSPRQVFSQENLTLTDEEREAIKAGIANCEDITYGGPNDKEAAAVLRRLLERLG
jgi:hypothetical protein